MLWERLTEERLTRTYRHFVGALGTIVGRPAPVGQAPLQAGVGLGWLLMARAEERVAAWSKIGDGSAAAIPAPQGRVAGAAGAVPRVGLRISQLAW